MAYSFAILAIAGLAQASATPAPSQRRAVMPAAAEDRQFFERYGFSEAVIDGDRVYVSGVVARPREGEKDPTAAYVRAFDNIADILARSGSSWDAVVDMTTYHTDLPGQIDAFTSVKNRYVRAPFPAWTAIDIDRLFSESALVEIKVVARRTQKP